MINQLIPLNEVSNHGYMVHSIVQQKSNMLHVSTIVYVHFVKLQSFRKPVV